MGEKFTQLQTWSLLNMKVFDKAIDLIDYTIIITDSKSRYPKKAMYITDTGKVIRKIRSNSKKAMKRKLKAFKVKYEEQELSKEDIKRSYDSWKGHARHGNCNGLIREMDVLYKDIFKEREVFK